MNSKQTQPGQGQNTQFFNQQTGGATQAVAQIQNQAAARRRTDRFPGNALSIAKELEDTLYAALDEVGDNEKLYTTIDDARAVAEALIEDLEVVREMLEREADEIMYQCDGRNRVECALDVADLRRLIMLHQDEVVLDDERMTPLMNYVDEIKDIVKNIEDAANYDEEIKKAMTAELHKALTSVKEILEDLKTALTRAYCEIMRLSIRMLEEFDDSNKERFADELKRIAGYLA